MKTFALISTVALSSLAAFAAENSTPAQDTPNSPAPCCPKAADADDCVDSCWLDIETITIEAANGDPIAQYAIAWITETGVNDTPADPEKAQDMYSKALPGLEKAAKEGNPAACAALAHMYANGKGVEKNPEKAREIMKWCKECAEKRAAEKAAAEKSSQDTPADAQPESGM
jgi:TPR repeat protein